MKKFCTTVSVLAALFGAMVATAQAEVKVASVNMTELNIMFYKRVDVEASLKKQENTIKDEIASRQEKVKALVEEAQKLQKQMDPTLSEAAVKKLREQAASINNELTAEQEELKTFVQRRQIAFREIVRRELALLSQELHETVQAVARENGYDVVIDSSAINGVSGYRVFPYVKPEMDITPLALKKLNAGAPAGFDAQAELERVRGAAQQQQEQQEQPQQQ